MLTWQKTSHQWFAQMYTEVIEALPEVTTSGLVLFHMMMQQSIARPFVLIKNDLALATERVAPIKKGEDLLQQFEKWYTSVLEIRYTEYVSLETLMESLCILLEKYQPLLKQCDRMYAAAGESQQEQFQVLDKIIRHIRVKAEELEQIRSKEPQVKTPSQPVKQRSGKGGKVARVRKVLHVRARATGSATTTHSQASAVMAAHASTSMSSWMQLQPSRPG